MSIRSTKLHISQRTPQTLPSIYWHGRTPLFSSDKHFDTIHKTCLEVKFGHFIRFWPPNEWVGDEMSGQIFFGAPKNGGFNKICNTRFLLPPGSHYTSHKWAIVCGCDNLFHAWIGNNSHLFYWHHSSLTYLCVYRIPLCSEVSMDDNSTKAITFAPPPQVTIQSLKCVHLELLIFECFNFRPAQTHIRHQFTWTFHRYFTNIVI